MPNDPRQPSLALSFEETKSIDALSQRCYADSAVSPPGERWAAQKTIRVFEHVEKKYGRRIALEVIIRLGVMQVCQNPALLQQFQRAAQLPGVLPKS